MTGDFTMIKFRNPRGDGHVNGLLFWEESRERKGKGNSLHLGGQLGDMIGSFDLVQKVGMDALILGLVVRTQQGVDIIQRQRPNVGKLLDLLGNSLGVLVRQSEVELLKSVLDSVPTRQTMTDTDIPGHAKVLGVENLVRRGVVKDGLGMDTRLVGESTVAGDVVVERHSDLDSVGNDVFDVANLCQVILIHDELLVGSVHAGQQTTQRSDTVALTNTQDGGVNVGGTSLES